VRNEGCGGLAAAAGDHCTRLAGLAGERRP
jgi:hypothetical protein